MEQFGFKDFEHVSLKATYDIDLGYRIVKQGEIIAFFDKIQIAGFDEFRQVITANGGFDNRAHVYWDRTREVTLQFSQGVFSKEQFALLQNAKINAQKNPVQISFRELLESDENGVLQLKYNPSHAPFVYRLDTGEAVTYEMENNLLYTNTSFTEFVIDYVFEYNNMASIIRIGDRLTSGFLELEGKTRFKDDTTGKVTTGIIKIPKIRLLSSLSIQLGDGADPVVSRFNGIGEPVGARGNTYVSEFYLLNDDIYSDL